MSKRKKMTSEEILDEFEKAREIKTPLDLKTYLGAGDESIREIAKLIAALCLNQDKWRDVYVADWTLYPKDDCYDIKHCKEAEALQTVFKEYDATVSPDVPDTRWLYMQRYSRPPVNEETIKGTRQYSDYYLNVPYETAKINLEHDSATAARFAQYAEEGRYSEVEEDDDAPDVSEKEPQTTEEDCEPNEERPSITIFNSRFRVRRDAFASAFAKVAQCAAKESEEPGERCVKVVANHNGVFLSATDGKFTAMEKIVDRGDFRVLIAGAFLVAPDDLARLFSETPGSRDEMLVFATHFSFLTIKGARFRYRFFVEDAFVPSVHKDPSVGFEREEDVKMDYEEEIPELCEEQGYYEMETESLKRMIRRTFRAVVSQTKELGKQKFEFIFGENKTFAHGTDGRIFVWQEERTRHISTRKQGEPFGKLCVGFPTETLERLEGFLEDSGTVRIAISEWRAQLQTENAFLTFPIAPGTCLPPDMLFANPKYHKPEGKFFAGDLTTALRCVLGNEEWSDENGELPVTLEMRNKRLVLARYRRLMRPPIVEIPLKYVGNRTSVVLDARRLYDFIAILPPEEPVVFRSNALFESRDGFRLLIFEK